MKYNKDTSEKILTAAITVFEEKGFSGTRMQEIADKANINKALLHYYYKSKDKLFEIILIRAIQLLMPKLAMVFNSEDNFLKKIENFVSVYIDILSEHPHIPAFVSHEINTNPKRLLKFIENSGVNITPFIQTIKQEIEKKTIIDIEPEQLIVNTISLCIFPFIAKPIITNIILKDNKKKYTEFIESRKKEVSRFIINAIKN